MGSPRLSKHRSIRHGARPLPPASVLQVVHVALMSTPRSAANIGALASPHLGIRHILSPDSDD